MKEIILLIIVVGLCCCSFSGDHKGGNLGDQLDARNTILSKTKYTSGRTGQVVEELYQKSLNSNEEIAAMNKELNSILREQDDLMEEYSLFKNFNRKYESNALIFVKQVKDSLLRKKLLADVKADQEAYEESLKVLAAENLARVEHLRVLSDQIVRLKYDIAKSMMSDYRNEYFPDVERIRTASKKLEEGADLITTYLNK